MASFTGVSVCEVSEKLVDTLFQEKKIPISVLFTDVDEMVKVFPHMYLVLKANTYDHANKKTALAKVDAGLNNVLLLKDYKRSPVQGLKPRNKEQNMLLDALIDEEVRCVLVEGLAGSGKSLLSIAVGLNHIFDKTSPYKKLILTRPMSSIGASLGALPGDVNEKFLPYLGNYFSNIELLLGENGQSYIETLAQKGKIEFYPLQLIGGISWHDAYIIADEVQSLTPGQFYALGTRVAESSKIVMCGDLKQRYGSVGKAADTGLFIAANSEVYHESQYTVYIKLLKQERGPIAGLFDNVFTEI